MRKMRLVLSALLLALLLSACNAEMRAVSTPAPTQSGGTPTEEARWENADMERFGLRGLRAPEGASLYKYECRLRENGDAADRLLLLMSGMAEENFDAFRDEILELSKGKLTEDKGEDYYYEIENESFRYCLSFYPKDYAKREAGTIELDVLRR